MKVCIIQFVKSAVATGERAALAGNPRIEISQTGLGFVPDRSSSDWPRHQAAAVGGLRQAREAIEAGDHQVVVLDEICVAVAKGLIPEAEALSLMQSAQPGSVLVLTGPARRRG